MALLKTEIVPYKVEENEQYSQSEEIDDIITRSFYSGFELAFAIPLKNGEVYLYFKEIKN